MGQLVRVSRQSVHIGSDTWTQQTLSRVHPFSCVDSSMFVSLTAVLGNGTVLSGAIWMSWFLKKTNLQPVTWRHLQSKLWNTNYEPFYFCPTILVCSNYTINSGRIKLPNKPKKLLLWKPIKHGVKNEHCCYKTGHFLPFRWNCFVLTQISSAANPKYWDVTASD